MLSRDLDRNGLESRLRARLTVRLGSTTVTFLLVILRENALKVSEEAAGVVNSPRSGSQRWGLEKTQVLGCPGGGKLSVLLMATWPPHLVNQGMATICISCPHVDWTHSCLLSTITV